MTGGEDVRQVRARDGAVTVPGGVPPQTGSWQRRNSVARPVSVSRERERERPQAQPHTYTGRHHSSPTTALGRDHDKQERNLSLEKCHDNIQF